MDLCIKKRKRTVLTARQHKILTKSFEECAFPDAEQRIELGKALNMTPRTVQIWFQNQRQKMKNNNQDHSNINSSEDTAESVENTRKQTITKSLELLAQLACMEYDRKFSKNGNEVEQL